MYHLTDQYDDNIARGYGSVLVKRETSNDEEEEKRKDQDEWNIHIGNLLPQQVTIDRYPVDLFSVHLILIAFYCFNRLYL